MRRRGLNIRKSLLGLILPALRRLPPRLATRAMARIGRAEYDLLPGVRHRVDAAVLRGETYFGGHWDRAETGRALLGNHILWRTRDRLLDGLDASGIGPLFRVEGRDRLDEAVSRGRGVVLLGNHFGSHMMPSHWLAHQGYELRLFMERPRHISKFLSRRFEADGQRGLFLSRSATPAESAGAVLRAAKALRAGAVMLVAGDVRTAGPNSVPARFLGGDFRFSSTWALLASLAGAPAVPSFGRVEPDGTHVVEFLDPIDVGPEARRPEGAASYVQRALDAVEERVRRHPAHSNDYFFWADEPAAAPPSARPLPSLQPEVSPRCGSAC